jgi:hypothetical protein
VADSREVRVNDYDPEHMAATYQKSIDLPPVLAFFF